MRKEKGITLIALVITIIVLFILAGVTIVTLTGDNGLLQKATTSKEENEKAKELELIKLAVSAAQVAGEGTITTDNLNSEFKNNFGNDKKVIEISNGWLYKGLHRHIISKNGNLEEKMLPEDYKEIEYLETTGTQYIITDLIDNEPWKCEVTFEYTKNPTLNNCIFGCNYGTNERFFNIDNNQKLTTYINAARLYDTLKINLSEKYTVEFDCHDNAYIKVNNDVIYNSVKKYVAMTNSVVPLMACARDGGFSNGTSYRSYARYYYAEFYNNNYELKHIFIPCIDKENVACMYDLISNRTFYNQGTGEFIAGPEV